MGFFSSLANAFCSAVSSVVSTLGSAVSSFASTVAPVLGAIFETIKPIAERVFGYAGIFLQLVGILTPKERVDVIGERALQAAEKDINIDKFDKFDDYMNALRKFELDPEVAAQRSTAEKLVAGLAVSTVGVEDKFNAERGSLNGLWTLLIANPGYFSPERLQSLVSTGRLLGDIQAYLEGRLSGGDARGFEKKLEVDADGKAMNESEIGRLYEALDAAREKWADIAKDVEGNTRGAQR